MASAAVFRRTLFPDFLSRPGPRSIVQIQHQDECFALFPSSFRIFAFCTSKKLDRAPKLLHTVVHLWIARTWSKIAVLCLSCLNIGLSERKKWKRQGPVEHGLPSVLKEIVLCPKFVDHFPHCFMPSSHIRTYIHISCKSKSSSVLCFILLRSATTCVALELLQHWNVSIKVGYSVKQFWQCKVFARIITRCKRNFSLSIRPQEKDFSVVYSTCYISPEYWTCSIAITKNEIFSLYQIYLNDILLLHMNWKCKLAGIMPIADSSSQTNLSIFQTSSWTTWMPSW